MSLITIDQLLESVDLDFEPRWIAKDNNGLICIYTEKPLQGISSWCSGGDCMRIGYLKLSEFDGKDWTECIYEVPRKTTGKIYKFDSSAIDTLYDSNPEKFKKFICGEIVCKLNEVIDAVNELKAKFALPTLNPDLTDEDLRKMMCDPKYWRDKDSATIQKVQNGFNKLYGDKN